MITRKVLFDKIKLRAYNNSMQTGTSHFVSFSRACLYYSNMGFKPSDVSEKIKNGEIKIGPPKTKNGQKLFTNNEGRYVIQD